MLVNETDNRKTGDEDVLTDKEKYRQPDTTDMLDLESEESAANRTKATHDVPGTSPEGPNVQNLQGTFTGPSGDQCQN